MDCGYLSNAEGGDLSPGAAVYAVDFGVDCFSSRREVLAYQAQFPEGEGAGDFFLASQAGEEATVWIFAGCTACQRLNCTLAERRAGDEDGEGGVGEFPQAYEHAGAAEGLPAESGEVLDARRTSRWRQRAEEGPGESVVVGPEPRPK